MVTILLIIGFTIVWVFALMICMYAFNFVRMAVGYKNIMDFYTGYLTGLALGPFAIMGAFQPMRKGDPQNGGLKIGGLTGIILYVKLIYYFGIL